MVARCSPCPAAVARKNGCGKKAVIGNSTLLLLATSAKYFPFRRHGHGLAIWQKHGNHLSLSFSPGFSWCLSGGFGWMWPIREFESGIPRAEIAQRARRGSHPDAHRSQRIAGLTTTTGMM